jgi:hypothetical protein
MAGKILGSLEFELGLLSVIPDVPVNFPKFHDKKVSFLYYIPAHSTAIQP